jgi:hypothetical protein
MERGLGVLKDRDAAMALYKRASDLGYRRRLAFEASDSEFSSLPSSLILLKLEVQNDFCAFVADLGPALALLASRFTF